MKRKFAGSHHSGFLFTSLGWGLIICILNRLLIMLMHIFRAAEIDLTIIKQSAAQSVVQQHGPIMAS